MEKLKEIIPNTYREVVKKCMDLIVNKDLTEKEKADRFYDFFMNETVKEIKQKQINKRAKERMEKYRNPNECGFSFECAVCMGFMDILDSIYFIESEEKFKKYYEIYKERFDYAKFHEICDEFNIWRSNDMSENDENFKKIREKIINEIYPEFQDL